MNKERKQKEPSDPSQLRTFIEAAARRISAQERSGIPVSGSDDQISYYIPLPDQFKKS